MRRTPTVQGRILLAFLPGLLLAGLAFGQASPLEKGRRLFLDGDYAGAREAWQSLAEAGDAAAMYNMATLYRRGLGVERDEARARELLRGAAEKGLPEAQYLLAQSIFEEREDGSPAPERAIRWWTWAALQGHGPSRYRLGLIYWNGEGVERDLPKGRAWMSLAAEEGVEEATSALSTMDEYLSEAQRAEARHLAGGLLETGREKGTPESGEKTNAFRNRWRIQLAAFRERSVAEKVWEDLAADVTRLVGDLEHQVIAAELGERGTFYRLQVGPFASGDEAAAACKRIETLDQTCFPVAPGS